MKAMFIEKIGKVEETPLVLREVDIPKPGEHEVLVKVAYCGICHTEIDEIEGRRLPKIPVIPGHEVVGYVVEGGKGTTRLKMGDRVSVAWIFKTCGICKYCKNGLENLCENFVATGADVNGGYAEYMVVHEDFAYKIPEVIEDFEAPPLLCAGSVGYRAFKLAEIKNGETVALFGFGASNHIVFKYIRYLYSDSKIIVFVRKLGDKATQLAKEFQANYIFETFSNVSIGFDKAIDTTSSGEVIKFAIEHLNKDGKLVINAIRKETLIPGFDYINIWGEREIKSVANVSREDVIGALSLASKIPVKPKVIIFKLEEANEALLSLKKGQVSGALVLKID